LTPERGVLLQAFHQVRLTLLMSRQARPSSHLVLLKLHDLASSAVLVLSTSLNTPNWKYGSCRISDSTSHNPIVYVGDVPGHQLMPQVDVGQQAFDLALPKKAFPSNMPVIGPCPCSGTAREVNLRHNAGTERCQDMAKSASSFAPQAVGTPYPAGLQYSLLRA